MKKLLISFIEFYQTFISIVFFKGACKYELSCSEYTKMKVGEFGVVKGSLMAVKRIWSCK